MKVFHSPADSPDFRQFIRTNRSLMNYSLNRILWFCVLTGPAIALGILCGIFKRTSYQACIIIFCGLAAVAGINTRILKKSPDTYLPSIITLLALDAMLCYMSASHISIRLTWCLVPLLSLMFCDRRIYLFSSAMNYLTMALATWLEAGSYTTIRTDFSSPFMGFVNIFSGCTIEAVIIFGAGLALGQRTNSHYRMMLGQFADAMVQKKALEEQLRILDSMAEIYDHVNLIDFTKSTEMNLRNEPLVSLPLAPGQDHTRMTTGLRPQIAADMQDIFWEFTDLTTVAQRLVNRKSISCEYLNGENIWFRAQYINVDSRQGQKPEIIIYTVQNIDADKRREEALIRKSSMDGLTRINNRLSYEEAVDELRSPDLPGSLAVISADVNGLKLVNDRLGHAAGDELIRGAADCMIAAIGSCGTVYRTGGDEFMAIVQTPDCAQLVRQVRSRASAWRGGRVDTVSFSIGFAAHRDHPDAGIDELVRLADEFMYQDKELYYRQSGNDRRRPS